MADCKGGHGFDTRDGQDDRYHKITSSDLLHAGIDFHASKQLTHVACYVDDEDNHALLEPHTDLPFITFGRDVIRGTGDFKDDKTNKKLCESISLENASEPTIYYSFAPDDDSKFIIQPLLRGLLDYVMDPKSQQSAKIQTDEAVENILQYTHQYHKVISSKHKRIIIQRIKKIINHLLKNNEKFKEQIMKIVDGERSVGTLQSFNDTCQKIVDDHQQQDRLDDISNQ